MSLQLDAVIRSVRKLKCSSSSQERESERREERVSQRADALMATNVGSAAAAGATDARPAICQRCPPGGARPVPSPGARAPLQRWARAGPGWVGFGWPPASARPPRFSKCIPPFCFRFPPPHVTRSARPHTHPFSPPPPPPRPPAGFAPLSHPFSPSTASFCSLGYYDDCDY